MNAAVTMLTSQISNYLRHHLSIQECSGVRLHNNHNCTFASGLMFLTIWHSLSSSHHYTESPEGYISLAHRLLHSSYNSIYTIIKTTSLQLLLPQHHQSSCYSTHISSTVIEVTHLQPSVSCLLQRPIHAI